MFFTAVNLFIYLLGSDSVPVCIIMQDEHLVSQQHTISVITPYRWGNIWLILWLMQTCKLCSVQKTF